MRERLRNLQDWKLSDQDKDIRGWMLRSEDGRQIGQIRDMIADTDSKRVESVVLDNGTELPVRDIEIRGDDVVLHADGTPRRGGISRDGDDRREIRVPVIEEVIEVGKREVASGGVRVRSEVTERPVEENVSLRRTEVHVERVPADRPATQQDFEAARRGAEAMESREEAVINRNARVVEEVVVTKDVEERTEQVREKARRVEPKVDDLHSDPERRDRR